MKKRSNAPIYWSLFGAGGMLSALVAPGVVAAVLSGKISYTRALGIAQGFVGKALLFAIASLFLWHAAHRIFHALHDVGIKPGVGSWLLCYGVAITGTVVSAFVLLRIGF
jgi:fumarate reductase subunit D